MPAANGDLLTTQQAAERLGLSVRQLHYLIDSKRLHPAFKAPGKRGAFFFHQSDIEALAVAS